MIYKKYLFIVLLVGFALGNTKILRIETQHKTFSKGELKSIVGNKVLYQAKNQLFKKGHIDSISIATINTIIFAPSNIETLLSSLIDFSVLGGGGAWYEGGGGGGYNGGTVVNTNSYNNAYLSYGAGSFTADNASSIVDIGTNDGVGKVIITKN